MAVNISKITETLLNLTPKKIESKLSELSLEVDGDQHRGFRQCDECGDGIDDEQTFYFWSKETTDKTFCHPSCVTLHYLTPWIEEKQDDKNNR